MSSNCLHLARHTVAGPNLCTYNLIFHNFHQEINYQGQFLGLNRRLGLFPYFKKKKECFLIKNLKIQNKN